MLKKFKGREYSKIKNKKSAEKRKAENGSFQFHLTENHDRVWFKDNSGLVFLKSEISRRNHCSCIGSRYFPFSPAKGKFGFQMRRIKKRFFGYFCINRQKCPQRSGRMKRYKTRCKSKRQHKEKDKKKHCFVLYQSTKVPPAHRTDANSKETRAV